MKKLIEIQRELKVPKNNFNSFGKYKYRSAEDILEEVKPVCHKYGAVFVLTDDIVQVGERYYIKATARLYDDEKGILIETTAFAREALDKKGMDDSQITGTASSYARKYALNGLFCIDDTKDADTEENATERTERSKRQTDKIGYVPAMNNLFKQLYEHPDKIGRFLKSHTDWEELKDIEEQKKYYRELEIVAKYKDGKND